MLVSCFYVCLQNSNLLNLKYYYCLECSNENWIRALVMDFLSLIAMSYENYSLDSLSLEGDSSGLQVTVQRILDLETDLGCVQRKVD